MLFAHLPRFYFGGVDTVACQHVELHTSVLWVWKRLHELHAGQMFFTFRDESLGLFLRDITTNGAASGTNVQACCAIAQGEDRSDGAFGSPTSITTPQTLAFASSPSRTSSAEDVKSLSLNPFIACAGLSSGMATEVVASVGVARLSGFLSCELTKLCEEQPRAKMSRAVSDVSAFFNVNSMR